MDISTRQYETFQLPVEDDDMSAESVRILAQADNGDIVLDETSIFEVSGNKKVATIRSESIDFDVGEYKYQLVIYYEDNVIDIYPDTSACYGDCELPKFIVCESIPIGVS